MGLVLAAIILVTKDSHLVDWLDAADKAHLNRTRLKGLRRAKIFSCLIFAAGWMPEDPKPGYPGFAQTCVLKVSTDIGYFIVFSYTST